MKRILYVESSEAGGGSAESLILNITYLDKKQYRPAVVLFNETSYTDRLRQMKVPIFILHDPLYSRRFNFRRIVYMQILKLISFNLPKLYLPAYRLFHHPAIRDLEEIVRRNNIDLIHLNVSPARDLLGVYVSRSIGIPCVSHIRSAKMLSFPMPAQQFANNQICHYIAISNFIQTIWTEMGVDQSKCTTILNGIHPLPYSPKDYSIISQKTKITFCTVGRLVGWKNHAWLLAGFRKYIKTRPLDHLIIIGDGPERDNLNRKILAYGLQENVTLVGEVSPPYQLMKQADIFVFPSRKEPFGRAVLEAMSLGLPIIAANSGGIPEFVTHNVSGYLVPLNDTDALTAAMLKLSSNGTLCKQLAQEARRQSETNLTIHRTVKQIETVYEKCLAQS